MWRAAAWGRAASRLQVVLGLGRACAVDEGLELGRRGGDLGGFGHGVLVRALGHFGLEGASPELGREAVVVRETFRATHDGCVGRVACGVVGARAAA